VVTGLHELARRDEKVPDERLPRPWQKLMFLSTQVLLTSMCIGTGMGAAAIFIRE
jgi:acetyl-CoA acetyltransferase